MHMWHTDAETLLDVVVDRAAMEARLTDCTVLERVWVLTLLGHGGEAIREGHVLLESSDDPFQALLVLAHAYQRTYRWREAGRFHEEALRLARTRTREALVRHQIGRRLFDEGLYAAAAAEFEWAQDLYRSTGRARQAETCGQARDRALDVQAQAMSL
ncbi:hypothetical protein LFT44_08510 [Arthrobacter sp. FW306-05-C]|uniref:hypothetical protein n=1 Tax=Arthrobacter sp. FW306-05-C TaxID=2879620 RepID=UPI001F2DB115|nr:hypothetical protein [Arthrobacter sp. FW306-05-C]UKA68409.1 hypothetical protein LFT44_08510 [Arthrobacter sp. FW306-05-C]